MDKKKVADILASVKSSGRRPDAAYIRNKVPIEEIAERLGIEVRHHRARCFRPENHANGDSDPSLYFKRNRAICFHCDANNFSNIELVMRAKGCDFVGALRWIACRFPVPDLKPGRPLGSRTKKPPLRVGLFGGEFEWLVRSGVWATLSHSACRILEVLRAFRDENEQTNLSYVDLQFKAGLSSASVRKGLLELETKHMIHVSKRRHVGAIKLQNIYKLTLDHSKLRALMDSTFKGQTPEIEDEYRLRANLKKLRRSQLRNTRRRAVSQLVTSFNKAIN